MAQRGDVDADEREDVNQLKFGTGAGLTASIARCEVLHVHVSLSTMVVCLASFTATEIADLATQVSMAFSLQTRPSLCCWK
jgi:hypothetical protein